jgi:hypothetical protein
LLEVRITKLFTSESMARIATLDRSGWVFILLRNTHARLAQCIDVCPKVSPTAPRQIDIFKEVCEDAS